MAEWENRPKEIAYLLNPAFCGINLAISSYEYYKKSEEHLPILLAYVILPLVLHKSTRLKIPKSTRLTFSSWLENNPIIRIDFYNNVLQLKNFINESLIFSINHKIIDVDGTSIKSNIKYNTTLKSFKNIESVEMKEFFAKSSLLGKWFGSLNSPSLIYSLLEITP